MEKRKLITVFTGLALIAAAGCNKTESESKGLMQALDESTAELNKAVSEIRATKAYGLFTMSGDDLKSAGEDPEYKVYIPLDLIKGVYDYSPVSTTDKWGISLIKYFTRTADNSMMIVNMPLKKVENPWTLRLFREGDEELENNFTIAVSDYHNNYNSYRDFDYVLKSDVSIDGESAGKLNIRSFISPEEGRDLESQYQFTDSYTAKYAYKTSDSVVYSFSLSDADKILYSEQRVTVKNETLPFSREHYYILTVGDVKIIRRHLKKEVEIYLDDVLQENAVVEIVDKEEDQEASLCRKRDIQITFDDGTTVLLSALIDESVEDIRTIFSSLHDVYFAAYIVDWIAYDIYYKRN